MGELAAHYMAQRLAQSFHGIGHSRRDCDAGSGQGLVVLEAKVVAGAVVVVAAAGAGDGETGHGIVAEAKQSRTLTEVVLAKRTKSWCQRVEMASGNGGPYDWAKVG